MKCFLNARSHLRAIRRPTPLRELQIVRLRSADGIKGRSHFASECPTVCPILKCWHSFGVPSDSRWSAFEPCLSPPRLPRQTIRAVRFLLLHFSLPNKAAEDVAGRASRSDDPCQFVYGSIQLTPFQRLFGQSLHD